MRSELGYFACSLISGFNIISHSNPDNRLFSQTATETWNMGESVNCDRPRTQTTSRSICSFAVIGRERLCVCPARPGARAANNSADWLITPSVLSLHRTLIWPSNVAYFSGTGGIFGVETTPC